MAPTAAKQGAALKTSLSVASFPRNNAGMAAVDFLLLVDAPSEVELTTLGQTGFLLALLLTLLLFLGALVLALFFLLRC